jgi:hypothetical protein
MNSSGRANDVGLLDFVAFVSELVMLALLAVAGWRLPDTTWARVVVAIALPLAAAVVWGFWMAPNSPSRLANPLRVVAQAAIFVVTALVCASAGMLWVGIAFAIVSVGVFGILARSKP